MERNNSPSNDEIAEANRKKRAQKAAEDAFNQPSEFAGISRGELQMIIDDAERREAEMKPDESPLPELSEKQIKKIQEKFLKYDYNFSDTGADGDE